MNFGLIVGEALLGLRRNISMVISVVLVTFVSLTFVGAAILMQAQIGTMRGFWGERAEVTIYMCSPLSVSDTCVGGEATQEQIDNVKKTLEGDALAPLISEVRFETKEEAFADFEGVWSPFQTLDELYDDVQVQANGYLPTMTAGNGDDVQLVASPAQFDEEAVSVERAPEHGEHTELVLMDLGYDWDQITALKESGAIL